MSRLRVHGPIEVTRPLVPDLSARIGDERRPGDAIVLLALAYRPSFAEKVMQPCGENTRRWLRGQTSRPIS